MLLQVRSLAGLQNHPVSHSPPQSCDNNANTLHSSTGSQSPHDTTQNPASNSIESRSFHHLTHHHHSPTNLNATTNVKNEHSAGINMAF